MSAISKIPRGIRVLLILIILAALVWFLAKNGYLYPGIAIAVLIAGITSWLIFRTPRSAAEDVKSKAPEPVADGDSSEVQIRGIEASTQPQRPITKPAGSQKPDASEVAAKYYRLAALSGEKEEEIGNSYRYLFSEEKGSTSKPAAEIVENQFSDITRETAQDIHSEMEPDESEPPLPIVDEDSSLTLEDKNQLVNAVWYRCENPFCKYTHFLDVHHIIDEKNGGTNKLDNLIVLCPYCHDLAHKNEIPESEMRRWIANREERFKFNLEWPY